MHWGARKLSEFQALVWADCEMLPGGMKRTQIQGNVVSPFEYLAVGSGRPEFLHAASSIIARTRRYGEAYDRLSRDLRRAVMQMVEQGMAPAWHSNFQPQRIALAGFTGQSIWLHIFDEEANFEPRGVVEFACPQHLDKPAPVDFYSAMMVPGRDRELTFKLRMGVPQERGVTSVGIVHTNGATFTQIPGFTDMNQIEIKIDGEDDLVRSVSFNLRRPKAAVAAR